MLEKTYTKPNAQLHLLGMHENNLPSP